MKIAVVGSGALGGFFGALFAQTGQDVTLVDVDPKKVEAIRASGLTVTTRDGERTVRIPITQSTKEVGPADLVFFSVKSYATLAAAQTLPPLLKADTLVMSIQNGIGNVEKIASVVGPERVVGGITAHSFQMLSPSHIRYVGGAGHMHIGKVDARNTPRVQEVAAILRQGGVEAEVNENIQDFIWFKLMVNTPINAIAAITRFKNGELAESEGVRQLMRLVADEAIAVAKDEGVRFLGEGHPVDACLTALRAAAENKASMLQDVEAGRRTEIDAINGAIVERAAKHGIAVPVNETLVRLVKVIEAQYLGERP